MDERARLQIRNSDESQIPIFKNGIGRIYPSQVDEMSGDSRFNSNYEESEPKKYTRTDKSMSYESGSHLQLGLKKQFSYQMKESRTNSEAHNSSVDKYFHEKSRRGSSNLYKSPQMPKLSL